MRPVYRHDAFFPQSLSPNDDSNIDSDDESFEMAQITVSNDVRILDSNLLHVTHIFSCRI